MPNHSSQPEEVKWQISIAFDANTGRVTARQATAPSPGILTCPARRPSFLRAFFSYSDAPCGISAARNWTRSEGSRSGDRRGRHIQIL